ncbi:MAG: PAS domain S-box protein [Deltaproteobacteria bacterium]|nr:PAS domain S-box protein [Deltaproteobacteria bacterium]
MEKGTMSNFFRSYGKHIVILFLFIAVGNVLLYITYENVRQEMIEGLNARQLIHAKQAARGIETFLGDNINILQNYSKNEHLVAIDESGKRLMREFLSSHVGGVSIISREDSHGRILYAEPYDRKVIGQPVTRMEDFLKAKRTHQITVSDVFTNRRGFQSIIVRAPIFRRGSFDGTLAMLFSFDFIAKRYIDDIRIGKDGYAWVISRNGIELSCPVPGHVGNSVFDNCRKFPDILAMAQRMIRGEQGVTTYLFDRIRGDAVSKTIKHAVFMPIRVGDNFWSIVVATPEDEVTSTLSGFQDRILLIAIFFVIGIGFFLYMLIKTGIVIKEVERRRKVEEELRKSEKRFRELAELLPEAVFETDAQGTLTFTNKNAFDRFGYTPEDFAGGLNLLDTVTPHDRGRALENTQRMMNRENIGSNEYTMQRKDGTIFPAMIHSTAIIQDGKPVGLRGFAIDITESKQAEEALRESEEKYRSIFDNAIEGIFQTTPEGRFLAVNPAMARIHGFASPEEMLAGITEIGKQLYVNPEDREKYLGYLNENGEVNNFEAQVYRTDGSTIWTSASTRAMNDAAGNISRLEGTAVDITYRKRAEEELQRTVENLRRAVQTTIRVMVSAVETRDPYTAGHQVRSANLARAIAMEMGLPQEKIAAIRMAGSIHDIGKLSIPAEILSKPTKLSEIEFSLIKEHARRGFEMLKDVESPWPLAEIVFQHHERMDGSGYPRNLKGDEICMEARILTVADVVEAMASHRPYRPGLGIDAALEEIEKNRDIFYDSAVADACLRLFREKGFKLEGA